METLNAATDKRCIELDTDLDVQGWQQYEAAAEILHRKYCVGVKV